MKTQEQSQHYPSILRCSRDAYSKIGDGILMKFKLIQALIVALIVCKWSQHFSHYKSMGIFQILKGMLLISPWSDPAEFRTHLRY